MSTAGNPSASSSLGGTASDGCWAPAVGRYGCQAGITLAVNVPLNDAIKAAGDPDRIGDLRSVRRRFNEARWAGWNVVRALASVAAFGCLA